MPLAKWQPADEYWSRCQVLLQVFVASSSQAQMKLSQLWA
jgi:hypothetical protein